MPFESRRRARDEKREAVLRTAVHLFLEQGYHRATLNEVAERLNITKPALYNYFRSKDEILFECWAHGTGAGRRPYRRINAAGGTGLVKLRKLVRAYARSHGDRFRRQPGAVRRARPQREEAEIVRAAKQSDRPYLSQLHHRGHRRRLDQAVRRQAGGLCHRRIAELDRALVSGRRRAVGGRCRRRILPLD